MDVLTQFQKLGIIPVVKIDDAKDAAPLAKALCEGGLPVAEVTFRTDAAEEAIRRMAQEGPEMLVGAGTVLTTEQGDRAVAAGAKFIVSPGLNPRVVKYCQEKNVPITPGTSSPTDIEAAIEVVIAGYEKKNAILTDREKMIVAYHEIGHALVAAKQSNSAPVQKITIVPRTSGALGYTMQVEENNHYLMSKEEIENKIATYTGGRAAEEIAIGTITTGASNDIEQATKLARAMITRFGMSEEFGMVALETVTNQYLGGDASLACSAETQTEIDREVVALVKKQYEKAKQIILETALQMLIREGYGAITVKTLAAEIGCSTQPIFSNFTLRVPCNVCVCVIGM